MKLADYTANPEGRAKLAKTLGVSEEAVRLWEKGERTPRPAMQRRIMEITGRLVTPMDFMASEAAA
jgi:transcriptional regulator with XRE-family HTH domain